MRNVNFEGNQPPAIQSGGQMPSQAAQEAVNKSQFFPNNVGPQQAPGNLPQEATGGQVRPVLSGDQLLQKTQQRQAQLASNNIVKPFEEVYNQVVNENEQNRVYNQNIENERQKRIEAQEKYGALAEERLKRLLPDASDEESAIFKKKGEDVAGQGKSEGEIDQYLSREASKYKNALSNIEKNLQAPRIQNKLQRNLLGKGADIKSVEQDAKAAIKPLLDLGLYEKSRTMLANAGFYPEERERIIFGEMPKDIKQSVDSIPKAKFTLSKEHPFTLTHGLTPPEKTYDLKSRLNLFENISKVWGDGENDKINLLQLRKEYEDKGYDWRIFKDAMNELVNNGHIILNGDQTDTFNSYLDNPPLNNLEKMLHGLGLRGR